LAQIASTWPEDKPPSAHAAAVIGSRATRRDRRVVAAARARTMPARSVSQATIDVAPSMSHSSDRSNQSTAVASRASSRSRSANAPASASPSEGTSSWSMAVARASNIAIIVHLFDVDGNGYRG
jgi:hypothetical protein